MTWGLFLDNAWRVRVVGMGHIAGIESGPVLRRLVDAAIDPLIAEDLIDACERGMVAAVNEKDETDGNTD